MEVCFWAPVRMQIYELTYNIEFEHVARYFCKSGNGMHVPSRHKVGKLNQEETPSEITKHLYF